MLNENERATLALKTAAWHDRFYEFTLTRNDGQLTAEWELPEGLYIYQMMGAVTYRYTNYNPAWFHESIVDGSYFMVGKPEKLLHLMRGGEFFYNPQKKEPDYREKLPE